WISGAKLRQAYHAAAVVAVPSLYLDPFPTVNLEAFACRKPVVATSFGGSSEIVKDGISGYIVDPNDTQTMGNLLGELLEDSEKATRFGEKGYELISKQFTLERQVDEYEKLYRA